MEPASIRYKNPGAMWGSTLATKWGAEKAVTLNDGLGQGNNIAVFPTYVQGICAQLDLWRTSPHYKNKRFADAIAVWSGGNNVESYISFVTARVPGMTRNTVMNDAFWRGPMAILFLKAQAWHEAGKQYPAPDADWVEAQKLVFAGSAPVKVPSPPDIEPVPKKTTKPAIKSKTNWASIGTMLTPIIAALTDWRVAMVIAVALGVFIILERTKKIDIVGWL